MDESLLKTRNTTTLVLHLAMLLTLVLSVSCRSEPFSVSQLAGAWRAEYVDKSGAQIDSGFAPVTGVETLTLQIDGTYRQVYEDGKGYVYVSSWNRWYLKDERDLVDWPGTASTHTPISTPDPSTTVIYLEGGRFYLVGISAAEQYASGVQRLHFFDSLAVSGKDTVLFPLRNSKSKGGIELKSPDIGDPDTPQYITFYRTDEPVAATTRIP